MWGSCSGLQLSTGHWSRGVGVGGQGEVKVGSVPEGFRAEGLCPSREGGSCLPGVEMVRLEARGLRKLGAHRDPGRTEGARHAR